VLAVGDAAFQKKCLGKIGDVAKQGRTVLFVSHNMAAINRICSSLLLFEKGALKQRGPTEEVVASYLGAAGSDAPERSWTDEAELPGDEDARLRAVRILNADGRPNSHIDIRRPFDVEIEYEILRDMPEFRIGLRIATPDGTVVFTSADSADAEWAGKPRPPGKYVSRCTIPGNLLNERSYALFNVWADIPFVKVMFIEDGVLSFTIEQTGGVSARYRERWSGVICPALDWNVVRHEDR